VNEEQEREWVVARLEELRRFIINTKAGTSAPRELALVRTKLDEAELWFERAIRVGGAR
jgi:hypothetical protein